MPVTVLPEIPPHVPPSPTNEKLDFADLAIIDLSRYGTPEGNAELVRQVRDAMKTVGFFYVINHGYTIEQTHRIFDIARIPFTVSDEEKQNYVAEMKDAGIYQGYKLRQYWHVDAGVRDQIEHYNIHGDVRAKEHPEALRPFLPEIEAFARFNHFNILLPLLRLLALGLELPDETFLIFKVLQLLYPSHGVFRMMKYYPRSAEDEMKTKNVWLKGHAGKGNSDRDSLAEPDLDIILDPEGHWKWVKHIENAVVINAGTGLQYLSGSFYKGTIHRVHQPPQDQADLTRLGLFYFAMFNDDVKLVPLEHSPVLRRVGIIREIEDSLAPTMGAYRKARIASYGQVTLKKGKEAGVEEEDVAGVVMRHYN